MIHTYARAILVLAAAVLAAMLAPAPAVAEGTCDENAREITIDVSPAVINLDHWGMWLTIHTDIASEEVAVASVYFNLNEDTEDEDAFDCWAKEDDLGFYVAKCDIRELNKIGGKINERQPFTLMGVDTSGRAFCGEQMIMIIDGGPESHGQGKGVK